MLLPLSPIDRRYDFCVGKRAVLMVDLFSVGFLQPNLIDAGENQDLVERLFVWFDPAQIVKGVEPTQTAREGWEIVRTRARSKGGMAGAAA